MDPSWAIFTVPQKNLSKGRPLAGGNPNVVTSQAADGSLEAEVDLPP